jgi:protein-arginine kinase activator protein McsA
MPKSDTKVCDTCRERPAIYHFTRIIDGVTQIANLCCECFEASALAEEKQSLAAMRTARCDFCGAQAEIGSTDTLAMTIGIQKMRYLCFTCAEELYRHTGQALQHITESLSQHDQLEELRKLYEETTCHMRQWISDKKGSDRKM